jgi:hypothetical protein
VTDSNNSDALNIGGEKAIGQAEKKTEAISGGEEMASECRLWRRGREGEKKQGEKETKERRFLDFHVAYAIKTFPVL